MMNASLRRLETAIAHGTPDRTPILSGWIACPRYIMELAGATEDEYWADPEGVSIAAYRELGVDGLIDVFVPRNRDDFRCVDGNTYKSAGGRMTLDEAVELIDGMPSPEQIERDFDFEADYESFRSTLTAKRRRADPLVWMPAQWEAGATISWYQLIGYEHFFTVVGLYPDRARKLVEIGGARGRCRGRLVAKAVSEGLYPHAVLLGEDICTQRGPMISPGFIERYYIPQLRYGLEPLLESGCKPVWHCDGDVRPLLDMLIDAGIQGLQGFQPECGMRLEELVERRTRDGEPLVIFGPLAVTTELPVMDPDGVRARVREAIDTCRGKASLLLFTSNTINPDVPLANIRAMYDEAAAYFPRRLAPERR